MQDWGYELLKMYENVFPFISDAVQEENPGRSIGSLAEWVCTCQKITHGESVACDCLDKKLYNLL